MNGRIYDPLLGRFLSADLVVDDPKDLQGYNRYSYAKHRPLTLTDPSGFSPYGEQFGRTGGNAIADWVMRKVLGPEKADQAIANREMVQREADKGTMVGGALVVGTVATGGAGMVIGEAALAGNTAAQLIVAGTAAVGLVDGTQKMAEGAGEFSVNPSVDSAAKIVAGGLEAGLSVAGVASVRTALAEAPVVGSTAASTRTTTAADSAGTPAPATEPLKGNQARTGTVSEISPEPPIQGPPTATTRVSNRPGNQESVELKYPDGRKVDINTDRVKEWKPTTDSRAPAGTEQKVKFENAQPGSKGYKRDPTPEELEILRKRPPASS
ncbi:MAG: hypothetical protein IPL39_00880 [Opitutaceae bacterium]|nr:hypothetical protein [Opitutaceae bacterium]